MKKYVCDLCGYVYDPSAGDDSTGVEAGTSFVKLPVFWICPLCRANKEEFYPIDSVESMG
jgi:rubredoxin